MSTLSKKAKNSALELVDDPIVQHNFELLVKQLKEITALIKGDNYMQSPSTPTTATGNALINSTTLINVDPLRINFTSKGGRIMVGIKPLYSDGNFSGLAYLGLSNLNLTGTGTILITRNGAPIFNSPIILGTPALSANNGSGVSPSGWFTFDKPGPGDHVYQVQANVSVATVTLELLGCVLYAKEFLG